MSSEDQTDAAKYALASWLPPSLAHAPSPGPRRRKPLRQAVVAFNDEFAPSIITVETRTPDVESDPAERLRLYGFDIHEALYRVMDEAADMGCLPLHFDRPAMWPYHWPKVPELAQDGLLSVPEARAQQHEELSPEWLVLACYCHAVTMSAKITAGQPVEMALFSHLPIIGATIRQI